MFKAELLQEQDILNMQGVLADDNMELNVEKLNNFIKNPNTYGFIVKDDNKIVGFAYAYSLMRPDNKGDMFYLHSIGILPEYQGQKLGKMLMDYIVKFAKNKGCSEVFVITDKSNIPACKLYSGAGMKNDFEDEIVYVKDFK